MIHPAVLAWSVYCSVCCSSALASHLDWISFRVVRPDRIYSPETAPTYYQASELRCTHLQKLSPGRLSSTCSERKRVVRGRVASAHSTERFSTNTANVLRLVPREPIFPLIFIAAFFDSLFFQSKKFFVTVSYFATCHVSPSQPSPAQL